MYGLNKYPAFKNLSKLANDQVIIDAEQLKKAEYWDKCCVPFPGFKYFYSTQRVDNSIFSQLLDLAKQAKLLERVSQVFSGERVNQIEGFDSENRPVLHTIIRDQKRETKNQEKSWESVDLEWKKLKSFEEKFTASKRFKKIFVVGIGGSELGTKAVYHALRAFKKEDIDLEFLSNLDPDEISLALKKTDYKNCLFIVISKSGSTLETQTNEKIIRRILSAEGLTAKEQMLAITSKGSSLDHEGFLERFYMLDGVGGRFSVSSMVGAVPLVLTLGPKVYQDFLEGAHAVDQHVLSESEESNAPLIAALISVWNRNFLSYSTACIVPYSSALKFFPDHIQQLVMESNGKGIDKGGGFLKEASSYIVWGGIGCNSQHSFFQLLHQGTEVSPVDFIGFSQPQVSNDFQIDQSSSQEKLLSNLFAQALALACGQKNLENPNKHFPGNRPSSIMLGKRLDPYTMGCLISFYESKTIFEGLLWGVNSFDQEGVQLGKELAEGFIDYFKSKDDSFAWGKLLKGILE
jgi:glucose-6-phosphate isomerase